jgi:site-specific recombinase XerD
MRLNASSNICWSNEASRNTDQDYREDFGIFLKEFPEKKTTEDFLPSDPNDFMLKEGEAGKASTTIARRLSCISILFVSWRKKASSPIWPTKVERPKLAKRLPVILSVQEVDNLAAKPLIFQSQMGSATGRCSRRCMRPGSG